MIHVRNYVDRLRATMDVEEDNDIPFNAGDLWLNIVRQLLCALVFTLELQEDAIAQGNDTNEADARDVYNTIEAILIQFDESYIEEVCASTERRVLFNEMLAEENK